ncbi:hypothetical protein [Alteromonas gilva]|uniref:Uncharacterized protein n=1 Tax=Alteromonas gilva TaxID=2987522 RepID=A0ABT5L020_9ALTE|nr:hypothetical protein [Alteromonas gilva]MDC8829791.1 hypothetical protein [Alteromonas gilva]
MFNVFFSVLKIGILPAQQKAPGLTKVQRIRATNLAHQSATGPHSKADLPLVMPV